MFRKTVIVFALVCFFAGQMAYAAGPQLDIAGQVQGAGTASMRTSSGWINVSGKSYPVANGSNLVTGNDGGMTITLKNGSRLELGKNSEVVVSRYNGNYSVLVQRGTMAYDIPQSAQLAVNTVNTKMTLNALSKGFLGEGKYTYVKSIAGDVRVSGSKGPGTSLVKAGETLRVAQANGISSFTQVGYDEAAIESAVASDPALVADASAGKTATDAGGGAGGGAASGISLTTGLIIGGVVAGGVIAAVVASHSGSSSPY